MRTGGNCQFCRSPDRERWSNKVDDAEPAGDHRTAADRTPHCAGRFRRHGMPCNVAALPRSVSHYRRRRRGAVRRQGSQSQEAGCCLRQPRPTLDRGCTAWSPIRRPWSSSPRTPRPRRCCSSPASSSACAALQYFSARRQVLCLHSRIRRSPFPPRAEASRRAVTQRRLLRTVRIDVGRQPNAYCVTAGVSAAQLRGHGIRPRALVPVCCTRSSGARRRASGGSAKRTMPAWCRRRATSSRAVRSSCSANLRSAWKPPARLLISRRRRAPATASGR